jgi:hypothetical protein
MAYITIDNGVRRRDVEVFYVSDTEAALEQEARDKFEEDGEESDEYTMLLTESGWYWWTVLSRLDQYYHRVPVGDPNGPFDTNAEATANAFEFYITVSKFD